MSDGADVDSLCGVFTDGNDDSCGKVTDGMSDDADIDSFCGVSTDANDSSDDDVTDGMPDAADGAADGRHCI